MIFIQMAPSLPVPFWTKQSVVPRQWQDQFPTYCTNTSIITYDSILILLFIPSILFALELTSNIRPCSAVKDVYPWANHSGIHLIALATYIVLMLVLSTEDDLSDNGYRVDLALAQSEFVDQRLPCLCAPCAVCHTLLVVYLPVFLFFFLLFGLCIT